MNNILNNLLKRIELKSEKLEELLCLGELDTPETLKLQAEIKLLELKIE